VGDSSAVQLHSAMSAISGPNDPHLHLERGQLGMSTPRARLHEGVQKSKLIAAIIDSDKFEESMLPEETQSDSRPKKAPREDADMTDRSDSSETSTVRTDTRRSNSGSDGRRNDRDGGRSSERSDDQQGGRNRNRNRNRNRSRNNEPIDESELEIREGILDILPEGYGFLRCTGYLPGDKDAYVATNIVREGRLRKGDIVSGPVRPARAQEKFPALVRATKINGLDPQEAKERPKFAKLTPLFPDQRLRLEIDGESNRVMARIIDLIAPIGKGQRGLIVSPSKSGKTTVLKELAHSISTNNPECHLMVVLVDERPEEVTDMQRSVKGEVIYSTFDRPAEEHTQVSELAIERAKRMVETGQDVVILLDSITRLARAHNLATPASGRILSGGVDSTALYPPKRFFGAARNIEEGGSLTIIATALIETGSRMDEVIFEEFKGTGNMELRLDRKLADRRIYPAIDIESSGTRREELLFDPSELQEVWKLRRVLLALESGAALELLIDRLKATKSNVEFLLSVAKNSQ
jgi:transcription termination factor Rho